VTELDLFGDPIPRTGTAGLDPPRVRNTDPDTSAEAAESLGERALGARCQELYELIANIRAGLTVHDLVQITGYDRGNTARRITDLKQAGWITDSGRRRRSITGRRSIVWIAVEAQP
jgi:MarR family